VKPLEPADAALYRLQNRLSRALGVDPLRRGDVVAAMMSERGMGTLPYWLLLLAASGIATFGLALDSTGVVIGAMLVSPLMAPIVAFGAALSVGSSWLLVRAGLRLVASCLVVPAFAALVVAVLPYQVVTHEIAARTSPTLLDLNVAILCGLIASFATAREASDTATAASGTAIAIALVPPLCVVGYGWGAGLPDVSRGAALLFLANMGAIVLVTAVLFTALGFGRVATFDLEDAAMERLGSEWQRRWALRGRRVLGGRRVWARLSIPLVVLVPLYFPLGIALDAVALQVRRSTAIAAALEDVRGDIVSSNSEVRGDHPKVWLTVVGTRAEGEALRARVHERLAGALAEEPQVVVQALSRAEARAVTTEVAVPMPPPASEEIAHELVERVGDIVLATRPDGPPRWRLELGEDGMTLEVEATPPLSSDEMQILSSRASTEAGLQVLVRQTVREPRRFDVAQAREAVGEALESAWPASLGDAPAWRVELDPDGVRLELVRRADAALPPEVLSMLADTIGERLSLQVQTRERWVPATIARLTRASKVDPARILDDANRAIATGFAIRCDLGRRAPRSARRAVERVCATPAHVTCADVEGDAVTVVTLVREETAPTTGPPSR
jgi:uncharacterized hydrophobic protein (TIGR00271 family)